MKKTFCITTLGCKVNQEESAAIAGMFRAAGWQELDFPGPAALVIVNSCSVTATADAKSRRTLHRAVRMNPDGLLALTGCFAQLFPEKALALPGVDIIVGTDEKGELLRLAEEALAGKLPLPYLQVSDISQPHAFIPIPSENIARHRTRAFLKIEDGCSQFCSYCIIPYARGPVRSLPLPDVLAAAERLLAAGYGEIVLSGIHIGAYGSDLEEKITLPDVLAELAKLPGLRRLRLGSIEPQELDEALLSVMAAHPNICPHLHVPLQSGSAGVLARMGRRYTPAEYAARLAAARAALPGLAVSTDVMVGFPGETEAEFAESRAFVESCCFMRVHVFAYSPRPGTPAAKMPDQLPRAEKERRSRILIADGERSAARYAEEFLSRPLQVLVEEDANLNNENYWLGHSANYLPLAFSAAGELCGRFVTVVPRRWQDGLLWAEPEIGGKANDGLPVL